MVNMLRWDKDGMSVSEDEEGRLPLLRGYALLDTPPEPAFNAIAKAVAERFSAPIALISLVDENRLWFKAAVGLDVTETPRSMSFCAHAIQRDSVLVVSDALSDPTFASTPLVTSDPTIRFYAGAPIRAAQGHRLGTICVIDRQPRDDFSLEDQAQLEVFAQQVMALIRLRAQAK